MSEADAAAGGNRNGNSETGQSSKSTKSMTTRQRRIQSQYHSTNGLWEQPQPRIKQASQREAAYLRSSGLIPTSKSKKIEDVAKISDTVNNIDANKKESSNDDVTRHFARQLGSTDARVRHKAIRQLKAYLKVRSDVKNDGLSEMDMIKLWKCFWYTLYLADRVPVQEELCQQLCSLIWSVAGTVEQDEYIAQSYLDAVNASGFMEEEDDYVDEDDAERNDDDDDDDDFTMEEIENTLNDRDEDDDEISENGEIDFEAKQLALLKEEDDEDDEEDDDDDDDNIGGSHGLESWNDEVDEEEDEGVCSTDDNQEDEDDDESDPMEVRHCQGAHLVALLVRTFWRTCVREWGKMDKYRIDKFYTCLRYMLAAMYDYMALRHWSLGVIQLFNDALHEEVLLHVPNGVRYHIVDCCLEELCKSMHRSSGIPLTEATIIDVLEPYFALAQTGDGDDPLQARVVEQVLLKFLNQYSVYSNSYIKRRKEHPTKEKLHDDDLIFDQVHVGTISQFIFQIAADDGVAKDEYRKALYDVHKQYERRIREVGKENDVDVGDDNGVENEIDDDNDDGEDLNDVEYNDDDNKTPQEEEDLINPNEHTHANHKLQTSSGLTKEESTKIKECGCDKECNSNVSSTTQTKGKKKKKKKKQNTTDITIVEEAVALEFKEEVITISKADQKAAQTALTEHVEKNTSLHPKSNTNKKRRNDCSIDGDADGATQQKRVKFGNINRARSYKASMENLSKLVVKPILEKSPERSIFLKTDNKNSIIAINHNPPTIQMYPEAPNEQRRQHQQTKKNQRNNNKFTNNRKRNGRN